MRQKGFTIVELMIVLTIASIMMSIAIPNLIKYRKDYIFNDYASQIEYLVKYGKIYAMEKTTNVAACRNSNNLFTLQNVGTSRSFTLACNATNECTGNNPNTPCIIKNLRVSSSDNYISFKGSGASFDPRGLAILPGSICVEYNDGSKTKHRKICISRTGIRTDIERTGECVACSQ